MNNGFNPLRWNCEISGCFNKKRRPKIEVFAECFPRRINFGDVDGLVELNGRFCLLEWKGDGGAVRHGQHMSYVAFTKHEGNIVFVVHGDAQTMDVKGYGYYWRGTYFRLGPATINDVKDSIQRWVSYCADDDIAVVETPHEEHARSQKLNGCSS